MLLAVELAIELTRGLSAALAVLFLGIAFVFVWRSFYAMRIESVARSGGPAGEILTEVA